MKNKPFISQQLIIARESAGLTQTDLSRLTGISRQSISKYENQIAVPCMENLLKISDALSFPIDYFYTDVVDIPYDSAVFFRKKTNTSKKICYMQKHQLNFGYQLFDYLDKYVDFPTLNIIKSKITQLENIEDNYIEKIARQLRNYWNLGCGPIDYLFDVIESNGIVILDSIISDEKLDASSQWINNRPFILLTDKNESFYRRRFNVAHELGHIILHSFIKDLSELSDDEYKLMEHQANYFASQFLVPDDSLAEQIYSIDMEYLLRLKKYWKVSLQTIIFKLNTMQFLTESQYLYLQRKISKNKWRKIEPFDKETKIEKSNLLYKAYQLLIDHHIIDNNQLKTELPLPHNIINHFLNIDELKKNTPILKIVRPN